MNSPTLNKYYNGLLIAWEKQTGKPQKPTCENCEKDLTGQKVIECMHSACGWVCIECGEDLGELDEVNEEHESGSLSYVGGGYAKDSRGNYREAFWAGMP